MNIVQLLYFAILIGVYVYLCIKNQRTKIKMKHENISLMLFVLQGIMLTGTLNQYGILDFELPNNQTILLGEIAYTLGYYLWAEIGLSIVIWDTKKQKK